MYIKPELQEEYHLQVGKKKIISLMKQMGIEAIYPKTKRNLSVPDASHKKFPYLLKELKIIEPNQVWGTDITYIRTKNGFAYLMALIDWFSRYVVAWKLFSTFENNFCIQALMEALKMNIPKLHNSDQGVQFTSIDYIKILENIKVKISMDGRGRCMDNIFTERL
ncbi:MAG: DDE-type integrase/transposase/recombinase [bacterium]